MQVRRANHGLASEQELFRGNILSLGLLFNLVIVVFLCMMSRQHALSVIKVCSGINSGGDFTIESTRFDDI